MVQTSLFLDTTDLEDEDTTLHRKVDLRLPHDATNSSVTLLRKPVNSHNAYLLGPAGERYEKLSDDRLSPEPAQELSDTTFE
jgi:hypothetical protein